MSKKPEIKRRATTKKFVARQVCPEFRLSSEEARTIGEELLRLGASVAADGVASLPAKKIVESARSKKSPLHRYIFGKSDAQVLQTAREALARNLVQSVRIEIIYTTGKRETHPIMVHVRPTPDAPKGYVPTETAQMSQYMIEQKFQDSVHRLNGWLDEFRAFRHGTKIGPLWEGVRGLLKSADVLDDAEQRSKVAARRRARTA